MEFWSCVMSIILGLSAIISPIITAIINNYYQLKLKRIDMYELSKRKALQTFNEEAISYKYSLNVGGAIPLRKAINNLYLFFDNIPSDISVLYNKELPDYDIKLNNIVVTLGKQITKE